MAPIARTTLIILGVASLRQGITLPWNRRSRSPDCVPKTSDFIIEHLHIVEKINVLPLAGAPSHPALQTSPMPTRILEPSNMTNPTLVSDRFAQKPASASEPKQPEDKERLFSRRLSANNRKTLRRWAKKFGTSRFTIRELWHEEGGGARWPTPAFAATMKKELAALPFVQEDRGPRGGAGWRITPDALASVEHRRTTTASS